MNRFNLELHRKWIEALRSGEYKQGHASLRTETEGFCCLGVVADLIGVGWELNPLGENYSAFFPDNQTESVCLPEDYDDFVGIGNTPNHLNKLSDPLMNMNDNGWTFDEIADALEVMNP